MTVANPPMADGVTLGDRLLRDQVRRVHEARLGSRILQERLEAERQLFMEQHAELVRLAGAALKMLATEEESLRVLAVARFKATGEKHPTPGVDIRLMKQVEYDVGAAFAWAKSTGMALTLDKKAFEKIAIAGRLTVATIAEVPRATIAQDLTEAIQG